MTEKTFDALVTRRTTERRYVTFLAPMGASPHQLAAHAVARAMDGESGWMTSTCDWTAELRLSHDVAASLTPDTVEVERLRAGHRDLPPGDPVRTACRLLREEGFVALLWHIDDVRVAQERLDDTTPLSDEECLAVLDGIERHHDAEHGVSWETLADALEDHLAHHPRMEATR